MSKCVHVLASLLLTAALLLLTQPTSLAQTQGVKFKLVYTNGVYTVYMTPNATPASPNLTLTAQVTIKVPHGTGANYFEVANLLSSAPGVTWSLNSRADAPIEAPGYDYLSFGVHFSQGNNNIFHWTANIPVSVFSFQNLGNCKGVIALLENNDPFMVQPNSASSNPGNQISILNFGTENAYIGNDGSGLADCTDPSVTPTVTPTQSQTPGVNFKVVYEQGVYTVYMTPNATPPDLSFTLTSQVTIKVPHGLGANHFTPVNLQSFVAGTAWFMNSQINAPPEAPGYDYLSFGLIFPTGNVQALHWAANVEVKVFSFQNVGNCTGAIMLLENDDPFMAPNSAGTNPGNQIAIFNFGAENAYSGNYGLGLADCTVVPPTATPTNTPTATKSATSTATMTPSSTPLPTTTSTNTPTTTPTHTTTPDHTATPTITPSHTPTATSMPTSLPTATSTNTPTNTPINTAIPTTTSIPPTATATTTTLPPSAPPPATSTSTSTNTPTATATLILPTATPAGPTNSSLRVVSISPTFGLNTALTNIMIQGVDFAPNATVKLGNHLLTQVVRTDATQLLAVVPTGLPPGVYDLVITNPDGQSAVFASAFTVQTDSASLLKVQPNRGSTLVPNDIYLYGFNFAAGVAVRLETTPPTNLPALFITSLQLRATVPPSVTAGLYDLTVTNPDGKSSTLSAAYTVAAPSGTEDLLSTPDHLWMDPITLRAQKPAQIGLVVQRQGGHNPLANVAVRFYLGDPAQNGVLIGDGVIPVLAAGESQSTMGVNWTPAAAGSYTLFAQIDPENKVTEGDEGNNVVAREFTVLPQDADALAPHIDSFTINNGAASTSNQTLSLNTSATDPTTPPPSSGLGSLLFIEYEYSQGAGTWVPAQVSNWLPYTAANVNYPWKVLPIAGMKYLQAWAADQAGNISAFPAKAVINYLPPTDQVGRDQVRLYRYTLAAGQAFTAQVEPINGDPDLYVWAPDAETRAPFVSNLAGEGLSDAISFIAPVAGIYQIEIYGYTVAEYKLTVTLGALNAATAAQTQDNHLMTAKPLHTQPALALNSLPSTTQSLTTAPTTPTTVIISQRAIYLPLIQR